MIRLRWSLSIIPYRKDGLLRALTINRADYFAALVDVRGTGTCERMLRLQHLGFQAITDRANPALSSVEAGYRFDVDHGGAVTKVESTSRVTGDPEAFHAVTTLQVRTDRTPCLSRTWQASTPRGLL